LSGLGRLRTFCQKMKWKKLTSVFYSYDDLKLDSHCIVFRTHYLWCRRILFTHGNNSNYLDETSFSLLLDPQNLHRVDKIFRWED
jgi:hypothetical protein